MRLIGLAVILTVSLTLAPFAAEAQRSTKIPRVGYLVLAPLTERPSPERAALLAGLRELGWIEGKTVAIEYRSAKWNVELLDEVAEELVRMKVDVIVATGSAPVSAAKQATNTIPIVMTGSADPVAQRLVASLARPGGNVTGMSLMVPELGSKRLELLKEVVPRVAHVAVIWNPATSHNLELRATRTAARTLGVALKLMEVRNADDLARAFAVLEKERPDALTMFFDSLTTGYRELIGDFAKKHRLPTVFGAKEFAEAGGLMSYAPNVAESFYRAAAYVDKILKGAKPGDLPVQQPTKFELVINLKTAKALGLTIPPSVLLRADQVIE
jgi:putative ABC transport system substrate-binding protein